MSIGTEPSILPGCTVLPPMDPPTGRPPAPAGHQGDRSKAKHPKDTPPARRKTAGRFAVLNAFVDFTLAGLNRNEIAVWLVLYRDTKDGTARTGQADIARRAGISPRSVRRGIEGLREKGLVKRTYQGGIGRGASAYRIHPLPPDRLGTELWPIVGGQF